MGLSANCPHCQVLVSSKGSLKQHFRRHHNPNSNNEMCSTNHQSTLENDHFIPNFEINPEQFPQNHYEWPVDSEEDEEDEFKEDESLIDSQELLSEDAVEKMTKTVSDMLLVSQIQYGATEANTNLIVGSFAEMCETSMRRVRHKLKGLEN